MKVFQVRGEFAAEDIDDALDFLARYFAKRSDEAPYNYDRASIIVVEPKPLAAGHDVP